MAGSGDQATWMEILPFSNWESRVIALSTEGLEEVKFAEEGAALVCTGGSGLTITCEEQFLRPGEPVELPDSEPGVAVVGRVLVDGEPTSGVRVSLALAGLVARRPLLLPLGFEDGKVERDLVTDAEGRFSTPPLADATYRVELKPPGGRIELLDPFQVPSPEDLVDETTKSIPEESASPPLLNLGDLEVMPGLTVKILVTDENGTPSPGAVVAASQGKPPGRVTMFQSRTDEDGFASLRGFEPLGPVQMTCSMPGFSRFESKFETPPMWIECALQPLAWLTGEVRSGGEGLEGVTVSLPNHRQKTSTDSKGRFQFRELDAGNYRLEIAAPGFEVEERIGALEPGEKGFTLVELEPAPSRWGRVIDAATGEPVSGARLVSIAPAGAVACTSDEGGELFFDAASNRNLTLEVSARGYPPHRVELKPEDGIGGEPWRLELATGGQIAVTVWSSTVDGPCVGCDLSLFKVYGAGEPPPPDLSLHTGEDGRAVTEDLPEGQYQIYLEEVSSIGSSVQVRSGHNVKSADVKSGIVTEVVFGKPRQTVEVRFRPQPGPGWRLRSTGAEGSNLYDSQADGSFKVRHPQGEILALRLEGNGISISLGVLAPETETFIELDLPRTSVTGRLATNLEMAVAPGLRVRPLFQNGSEAWVMPGSSGRFEIPFLLPGVYRIALGDRDLATFNLTREENLELGEVPTQQDSGLTFP